jgi:hypothetical protein
MSEKSLKRVIFFLPFAFLAFIVLLKFSYLNRYWKWFAGNDGPLDWAQFAAYMLSCLIGLLAARDLYEKKQKFFASLYLIFAVGMFLIGFEEISWGQVLFHYKTPGAFKGNLEHEFNLHNFLPGKELHFLYIVAGFYGAFARLSLSDKTLERHSDFVEMFMPAGYLFFYFFPVFFFYFYYDYASQADLYLFGDKGLFARGFTRGYKEEETVEFLLSCGFLIFAAMNALKLRAGRAVSRKLSDLVEEKKSIGHHGKGCEVKRKFQI